MSIDIDLWQGEIITERRQLAGYEALLDNAEKSRAQSFKFKTLQLRYVLVHGLLRKVLAEYLRQAPETIQIAKAEHGKPYLVGNPDLAFNISHTGNQLVIAITSDCQLGVDIECYKPRANMSAIVKRFFATSEALYWHSLPESLQLQAFYHLWTAKEAFLKATGLGIALGLHQCVLDPESVPTLLAVPELCGEVSDWSLLAIDLGADICCHLAANKAITAVKLHSLSNY